MFTIFSLYRDTKVTLSSGKQPFLPKFFQADKGGRSKVISEYFFLRSLKSISEKIFGGGKTLVPFRPAFKTLNKVSRFRS